MTDSTSDGLEDLERQVRSCKACADRFARTRTAHEPRPVFWCSDTARILIVGQAPGLRVHESGIFFNDASGDRLRNWLGIDRDEFYDRKLIAILPMAFCFPGYNEKGADLPPPSICAELWRQRILDLLPNISLTILVGGHAQRWHLDDLGRMGVSETVRNWHRWAPATYTLPHPSWRNNGLVRNLQGFESELLPELKLRIRKVLDQGRRIPC